MTNQLKMKGYIILLFSLIIVFVFISFVISQKKLRPKEATVICDNYFATGKIVYDKYSFCSIIPVDVEYPIKKGVWKFWNLSGTLIAEGEFNIIRDTIKDRGGCEYEIKKGVIELSKWEFWEENGNRIIPGEAAIKNMELCQFRLIDNATK